jgi:hypothetical protein
MKPKILVISNTPFSNHEANGKTLKNIFNDFNKTEISQFFIKGNPDFNFCNKYYRFNEMEIFKNFFNKAYKGEELTSENSDNNSTTKNFKKTPFLVLLREFLWFLRPGLNEQLMKWIKFISPDYLFLNLSDNFFLINLTIMLSKLIKKKIIVYSTENYVFKNYNYINKKFSISFFIFQFLLRFHYKKLNEHTLFGVFNSEELATIYKGIFRFPCEYFYTPSYYKFSSEINLNTNICYFGNLGLGRHNKLLEIADVLKSINSKFYLNVYTKLNPQNNVSIELSNHPNICLKGFLTGDSYFTSFYQSTLLIHSENDSLYSIKDLKYSFSSKIPDIISSGITLFFYGHESLVLTKFLQKNNCAFLATNKSNLYTSLKSSLIDIKKIQQIKEKAFETTQKYFKEYDKLITLISRYA